MTAEVVEAYESYVSARQEARARSRERVKAELQPHLVAIGKAVESAQRDGLSIAEIARVLDIKNRNFIYESKRAYGEATGEEIKVREYVRTPKTEAEQAEAKQNYEIVQIEKDCFEVKAFGEDYFITTDEEGYLLFPEEWADLSGADRATVREIIADIKERV